MGWNLGNSTYLIICIGFPTSCEVKYDIWFKKLINNRFKQPCRVWGTILKTTFVNIKFTA